MKRYNVKALILLSTYSTEEVLYGPACQRFLGAAESQPPSIHANDFGHIDGRHSYRNSYFQGSERPGEEKLGCDAFEHPLAATALKPVLANLQATGTDRGQY